MVNIYRYIFLLFVFLVIQSNCGDKESTLRLGINYFRSSDMHNVDFRTVNGNPSCCDNFKTGEGNSQGISLTGGFFPADNYGFNVYAGYNWSNGKITVSEDETINVDGQNFPGLIEHYIDFETSSFSIAAGASYNFYYDLFINTSLVYENIASNKYEQGERILVPSDKGVFKDTGTRYRNEVSGELDNINNSQILADIYLTYVLPMSSDGHLEMIPAAGIKFSFNDLITNKTWKRTLFYISVGINFNIAY